MRWGGAGANMFYCCSSGLGRAKLGLAGGEEGKLLLRMRDRACRGREGSSAAIVPMLNGDHECLSFWEPLNSDVTVC